LLHLVGYLHRCTSFDISEYFVMKHTIQNIVLFLLERRT